MVFVTVTGERLILGTRRITIYGIIVICVTAPVTFTMHFLPPYLQSWQIPCYTVSYLVMGVTLFTFSSIFRSLFRAATLLNNCFKVRNSRNFIYEDILWHSASFYSLIFSVFFIFLGKLFYLTLSSPIINS